MPVLRADDVVRPASAKLIRRHQEWIELVTEYSDGAGATCPWRCELRIQDLGNLVARAFQMRTRFPVGRLR